MEAFVRFRTFRLEPHLTPPERAVALAECENDTPRGRKFRQGWPRR